jgi:hypothetical protein
MAHMTQHHTTYNTTHHTAPAVGVWGVCVGKYTAAAAGLELWHYSGEWRRGVRSGQGRLVYVTGEEYEGGFEDDCFSGKGTKKYIGEWEEYMLCGYIYIYIDR